MIFDVLIYLLILQIPTQSADHNTYCWMQISTHEDEDVFPVARCDRQVAFIFLTTVFQQILMEARETACKSQTST